MKERVIEALQFLMKDECRGKWITFAENKPTVDLVCYMNNLGLVQVNQHGQMRVNPFNAELYLSSKLEVIHA